MIETTFAEDAIMFGEDEEAVDEEVEHMLYNQVFHSSENTDTTDGVEIISSTKMSYSSDRYFRNENTERHPYSFVRRGFRNVTNYPNELLNLQGNGCSLSQMVVSPINNIVVLSNANPPSQVFVNNQRANRPKRWKKSKRKKEKRCETLNTNIAIVPKDLEKGAAEKIEIVDISDSDDSDVCYIEVKHPLVVVSSDDEADKEKLKVEKIEPKQECNNSPDEAENDVIFVPTEPKEIETLTIDDDSTKLPEDILPAQHIPRKEILETPESTMSNDFLEPTAEFSQTRFNFGLHGMDFTTREPPPKPPTERSETESSASDVSTPLKTAVFNEVPFECPTKNIFNENNLEQFADFIVPKRAQNASTPKTKTTPSGSGSRKRSASFSSDSSSECDYDELRVKRKSRRLPSLSVFEENATETVKSDAEESKVNVVSRKEEVAPSSTRDEPLSVTISSDDDVKTHDSDASNCPVINMDNYITIDEDFDETLPTANNEEDSREAILIDSSSDSDESFFNTDDLENVGDDLQISNCESFAAVKHEPRDEAVQKTAYSFDTVWTEDKDKFYGESWGHENFSVTQAQKTMSDDPELWKILDVDKTYMPMVRHRERVRRQKRCFLCGLPGHLEPRCPNKLCTMCGSRISNTATYCSACTQNRHQMCKLCKMKGHLENRCPDLWRRYFLTTKEGSLVRPTGSELKDDSQLSCSGCGKMGHLEHMCTYYNRTYPPVNPLICRYDDVYGGKANRVEDQRQQNDLRTHLQNKERKAVREERGNVNIPNYPLNYEVTTVNDSTSINPQGESQQFGSIFDRNKDLVADSERQQTGGVFDRNRDLASTSNAESRYDFNFLKLSQNYFAKAKKSRLLLNPCVTSSLNKQKRPSKFNGFEPDVEKPTPASAPVTVQSKDAFPSSVDDMRVFLNNAISRIDACRNLDVTDIWQQLQKEQENFDEKPNELTHQKIKSLFERLHIILFGIHKVLEGAVAVKTLMEWRKYLSNEHNNSIVLPQHGLTDIKKSYDYIFGNSRRDLDYQNLINSVNPKPHWANYVHHDIHKDYNFFLQNSNGTAFKKLHALYAKVKSGKGNIGQYAEHFKNTFKIFYSNVCRNKAK